ncbi:MAG: TerB family tellurite resistance protein [Rhizobiaceae bacterium]
MFDRLMRFLRSLPGDEAGAKGENSDDPRIAAVALMFHVIDADGIRETAERDKLEQVLRELYPVSGGELKSLIAAGEEADREAVDLYAFTSVLKRHLGREAKINLVRILWEMVYADGERHELEENIVWRVAELIGVEQAERVAMRQEVEADLKDGE